MGGDSVHNTRRDRGMVGRERGDYVRNTRHDGGMVGREGGGTMYVTQDVMKEWWGGGLRT